MNTNTLKPRHCIKMICVLSFLSVGCRDYVRLAPKR